MTDATDQARAAIAALPDDEDDLYRMLALRVKAIERDPAVAGDFSPRVDAQAMGITVVDLVDFGRRMFARLALAGHSLVCGAESDEGYRLERLLSVANRDVAAVTAAVATLLVGQLAIAPAVAGIVATIIVGKVAPASLEALCEAWGERVAATGGTGTTVPGTPPEPPPPAPPPG